MCCIKISKIRIWLSPFVKFPMLPRFPPEDYYISSLTVFPKLISMKIDHPYAAFESSLSFSKFFKIEIFQTFDLVLSNIFCIDEIEIC